MINHGFQTNLENYCVIKVDSTERQNVKIPQKHGPYSEQQEMITLEIFQLPNMSMKT